MVPVVDLSRRGSRVAAAFGRAAERIAASGMVLLGDETASFERELAEWCDRDSSQPVTAVAVASGASAIQLALAGLGIGPGDEVIVPSFTAVPTASAVLALGAVPVLVDVEADTANLDPAAVRAAVTDRTKAVIVVHLYGLPAELPDVGVPIVEDAAQAQGAIPDHARSAAVVFSFYPTKNLGGIGDGGAVVTRDPVLADRVRRLRVHGMTAQYVHESVSQNFRMSELEAAWLRLGLPELDAANARRRAIAERYRAAAPGLRWQHTDARHTYHLCVVRADDRERFRSAMADGGVATAIHYPLAVHQQPAYRHLMTVECPNAESWAASCVSVPCFPELTDDEVSTVAGALQRCTGT